MSSKDMFRKEQRFSFRKFSFGLASAVIANVIFGGAIANTPVVHANTTTETAAVATSERIASIPYTVNIVDQAGKVVETKEKKVLVYTVETIATATEYLTADLVPEGYAIVSGLGEVTLTENAENVFTVKVDKIAPEAVATTTTAESATSETATAAATPEPASLAATQPTPVTSEVAEAEVAPTTSEESAKPAERTVYLSYITHYVNEANETVDRTGHLVAVTTTDETAKTQVTVSASENMPSGWELVQDKAKVVVQLVENQTNILVFAVTKKSKEEEIAASQLSNKDVLEQVLSEGVLLSNDAARLLETSQAGNTGLEVATNNTKAVLKEAIQVFDEPSSTQEQVDAQTELVRAASKTLADELLKFDEDGVLTAMLDATTQGITVTTSSKGKVRPNYPDHIRDFATNEKQREYENQDFFFGLIGKELTEEASQISATAQGPDGSPLPVSLVGGGWQEIPERDRYGLNINNSGVIYGTTTIKEAGNTFSWRFKASSSGYETVGPQFTFVPYTVVKTDNEPIRRTVQNGVTADDILAKVKSDVTRGNGTSSTTEATAGPLNIAFEQHFNENLTARATGKSTTVTEDAKDGKQIWHEIEGEIPTTAGTHTVTVRSTNVHGQTIDTQVVVDLYEIVKIPSSASEPAPQGYVTVSFNKTPFTQGFTLGTQTGESVKLFVKENVKWGELLNDPAWQWPTVKTAPGDTVVGWGVNVSSADNAYKPENAFSREKYKDIVVTDTKLYPNVVYEVEEVGSRTKDEYLALYGPDERDKWIFIKFDAGQGSMTYDKKQYTSRSVAAYFQGIGYDNSQFTSKVVSPTLANHTFVRWQTDAGEVLPKSGTITTE
ncbi:YSIRK-type signal peptide-containing protein, partial [Streptococcus suis]|uniref:YSIRK-type signal peptide-containing protein n=1 Tax=Streptococcus suis TaxID=1307 RepID=UPI002AABB853